VRFFDDAFTFCEARSAGHILVYFIPGDDADTTPGKRRLKLGLVCGCRRSRSASPPDRSRRAPASRFAAARRHAGCDKPRSPRSRPARSPSMLPPWWPQRPSRFCRRSLMWVRCARSSAACACSATRHSSSGHTRPEPPPKRLEMRRLGTSAQAGRSECRRRPRQLRRDANRVRPRIGRLRRGTRAAVGLLKAVCPDRREERSHG